MLRQKRIAGVSAFSLIELSVIIALMSILATSVLVARHLIDLAKVNRMFDEVRHLKSSIMLFHDLYGCQPGNCTGSTLDKYKKMTHDLGMSTASGSGSNGAVSSIAYLCTRADMNIGNGEIESSKKRTCMMLELYAAGWVKDMDPSLADDTIGSGNTVQSGDMETNMGRSVAGMTMPRIKGDLALDYATVDPSVNDVFAFPVEGLAVRSFRKNDMIVVRSSNSQDGIIGTNVNTRHLAGISPRMAKSISSKFGENDSPFGKTIIAGRNPGYLGSDGSCYHKPGNQLSITLTNRSGSSGSDPGGRRGISLTSFNNIEYLDTSSSSVENGCIMGFLMEKLTE